MGEAETSLRSSRNRLQPLTKHTKCREHDTPNAENMALASGRRGYPNSSKGCLNLHIKDDDSGFVSAWQSSI